MTEQLPWGSPGTPAGTPASRRDRRHRASERHATVLGEREPQWPDPWLEDERARPAPSEASRDDAPWDDPSWDEVVVPPSTQERARPVERWSQWAAGLGRPARDTAGGPYVEGLLPPAVWLVAALAVAGLVGLLTGVLISSPEAGSGSARTAVTTTVTVTNEQTTTATMTTARMTTQTATRTRTRTVTAAPQVQATGRAGGQISPPNGQNTGRNGQYGGRGLGPGSQGLQVFLLQQALAQLGLFQGRPDGVYDGRTQAAVQNFQARAGITADPPGVAGPATIQALRQALG